MTKIFFIIEKGLEPVTPCAELLNCCSIRESSILVIRICWNQNKHTDVIVTLEVKEDVHGAIKFYAN